MQKETLFPFFLFSFLPSFMASLLFYSLNYLLQSCLLRLELPFINSHLSEVLWIKEGQTRCHNFGCDSFPGSVLQTLKCCLRVTGPQFRLLAKFRITHEKYPSCQRSEAPGLPLDPFLFSVLEFLTADFDV